MGLAIGLLGLFMACYGGSKGIQIGLTSSTDHPSGRVISQHRTASANSRNLPAWRGAIHPPDAFDETCVGGFLRTGPGMMASCRKFDSGMAQIPKEPSLDVPLGGSHGLVGERCCKSGCSPSAVCAWVSPASHVDL